MSAYRPAEYWEARYRDGRLGSGPGSRAAAADAKAAYVNRLIARHRVRSVVDWGCGDGRVASRFVVPRYIGLDVSAAAVEQCREACGTRRGWAYRVFDGRRAPEGLPPAELSLSLDVIFHQVDPADYAAHLALVFGAAPLVCIHSSNRNEAGAAHVLHRRFTDDVPPGWDLLASPDSGLDFGFYVYRRGTS